MSDRGLRLAIAVLALVGLGVAGYLTYVHYAGVKVLCLSSGGCETVQASRYAKLAGIPVAVLGLGGYVLLLGSALMRSEAAMVAGAAVALVGLSSPRSRATGCCASTTSQASRPSSRPTPVVG